MAASYKEVKTAVNCDLKLKGMTHAKCAKILGIGKQTFSNQISQKAYFTNAIAFRLHEAFGYNMSYLLTGEGTLLNENTQEDEYSKKVTELNSVIAQKDAVIASLKQIIVEQAKILAAKKIVIIVDQNSESDDAQ